MEWGEGGGGSRREGLNRSRGKDDRVVDCPNDPVACQFKFEASSNGEFQLSNEFVIGFLHQHLQSSGSKAGMNST